MNWNIDYPNNTEIENQKRITLDKAFLLKRSCHNELEH